MTADRLKTTAFNAGRILLGAALGVGLVAAVAFGAPARAFAQEAAAAVAAPQAVADPGPALWVIRDADSTIYLFGTVHVLRPETVWRSHRVEAAFDSASEVWFEISNPADQAAMIPLIRQHGLSPDQPLSHRLTANELNALQLAAHSVGSGAAQMDSFRPWLAALTLSIAPLVEAGYDPNSGVELTLRPRAVAAGKTVKGLESIDEQVRIIAGFSEPAQMAFLRATLDSFEDAPTELDAMVNAWAAGDLATFKRVTSEGMRESGPEVYRSLLTDRNRRWAGQIQTMLEGSGTVFIAVGAAHLAGDDSVIDFLEARGVTVSDAPR